MADIVTTNAKLSIKLTMRRDSDGEEKTRTFSIDNPVIDADGTQFRGKLQALQNFLLGDGKNLIQPTGWRDDDATEDEYTTTAVEFTTSAGADTEWDTRLSYGLSLSPSTIAASMVGATYDNADDITISGSGFELEDLQFRFVEGNLGNYLISPINYDTWNSMIIMRAGEDVTVGGVIEVSLPESGVYQAGNASVTIVGG